MIGGYFAVKSDKVEKNDNQETVVKNEEQPSNKKMAFSEFAKQGGAYKCEVKQNAGGVESSGVVYIGGEKIRGEFDSIVQGKIIQTFFIVRDGYSHTWTSMYPNMGFKAKVSADTEVNTNTQTSGTYSWNVNQIGDYDCDSWALDASKFILPAGVNFTTMGAL
jgi:hypothetical protein